MQRAPVLKGSGLTPIDDEPVHVFGRNLESRVVEARDDDEDKREDETNKQEEDDVETIKKRKFDAITGEENEETIFQGEFKLFVWDFSTSNWIEKGRGQLKLNDDLNERRSRLIMRVGGTFRIILNVAIRHSLFKVISNTKTSIRFSDSQNVWAASGSNAKELCDLLNDRIAEAAKLAQEADERTKELKGEENDANNGEKNKAEDKEEIKVNDHPPDDKSAEKEDDNTDKTNKSDADELGEGEQNENDQKEATSGEDAPEEEEKKDEGVGRERSEESRRQNLEKEVAGTTATVEDEEKHNRGEDETKRLKLSSD